MLSLGRSRAIAKHTGFRGFLWVGTSCWEEVASFIARAVLSVGRSRTIAKHRGFRGFLAHDDGKRCLFIVIWGGFINWGGEVAIPFEGALET